MQDYVNIMLKGIFIENMIFAYFLGMCSYLAVSKTVKTGVGLGAAVIFVLGITVPINWLLENYVLKEGALAWLGPQYATMDLSFLSFIMFIAVIASMVQLVEMLVEKFAPALYGALGIFLPLIAVNCSVLGGALFMQERQYSTIGEATTFGIGSGIGWFLAIVAIAAIREKIKYSKVPAPMRGLGITFVITGLMGIAFMAFSGVKMESNDDDAAATDNPDAADTEGDDGQTSVISEENDETSMILDDETYQVKPEDLNNE